MRACNCEQAQELRKRIAELEAQLPPANVPVKHKVTCKLFPDPFDERDPVGPCTCGAV